MRLKSFNRNHNLKVVGPAKKALFINQRKAQSTPLYCKYDAVTNNPAKGIGIRPNTIPNRKTEIISI